MKFVIDYTIKKREKQSGIVTKEHDDKNVAKRDELLELKCINPIQQKITNQFDSSRNV